MIEKQVRESHGIARSEIPSAVCRVLGFARVTENMASIVEATLREQIHCEELIEKGEVIVWTGS